MNFWQNAVVTDAGIALQSRIINGHTLKIVRAVTGAGTVPPVNLRQQTEVTSPKQEIRFLPASVKGEQITIPVVLENTGWNERYELWQVGLYAERMRRRRNLILSCSGKREKNSTGRR